MQKDLKNILRLGGASLVAVVTVALALRRAEQMRVQKRTKLLGENAVDETIAVRVYGTTLKALVRGEDRRNPVLLMVHGGPGTPEAMVAREYDMDLVDDFVVVRYDQRGTGRSPVGRVPIKRYSLELFVDDVLRMARALRARFPDQGLVLVGNSWGSVLGMLAVKQQPDLFDAYVGISQVIDLQTSDPWSYDYALEKATALKKTTAVKKLKRLDRDSFFLDYAAMRKQRSALYEVGGVMVRKATQRDMLVAALRSPDYSLIDLFRTAWLAGKLGRRLYPQMALTNLMETIEDVEVPVFFIDGTEDRQVSPQLAHDFLQRLRAPIKKMLWVEDAGHFFDYEKPYVFYERMLEVKAALNEYESKRSAPAVRFSRS